MKNKGNLIVISGPSGTGKGTVCKELLKAQPEIVFSISATTRKPRPGEVNGKDYWFLSKEEFQQMIAENRLLEWAEVYGNYYGTPADKVREVLESGKDVLLEKRIRGRGTETEEAIKRRLSAAIEEIPRGNNYDYIITNEVVSDVVNKILHIIEAERCAVYNNLDKLVQLENEKV